MPNDSAARTICSTSSRRIEPCSQSLMTKSQPMAPRSSTMSGACRLMMAPKTTLPSASFAFVVFSRMASDAHAVHARRGIVEHHRALACRVAARQTLERVVHDIVGERDLVHREVRLEHAAAGPELLDAVRDPRLHRSGQLLRPDGRGPGVPIEARARHADAA